METHGEQERDTTPSPKSSASAPQTHPNPTRDLLLPHQVTNYSPLRTEQTVVAASEGNGGPTTVETGNGKPLAHAPVFLLNTGIQDKRALEPGSTEPAPRIDASAGFYFAPRSEHNERRPSDTLEIPHPAPRSAPKQADIPVPSTPPGRRSVQFARPAEGWSQQPDTRHQRSISGDVLGGERIVKERRGASLFSKLRALTTSNTQGHLRSPSAFTVGGDTIDERFHADLFSPDPTIARTPMANSPQGYESDLDADGEESQNEDSAGPAETRQKKRKSRRPYGGVQTAPTTPKTPFMRGPRPSILTPNTETPMEGHLRHFTLPRRATIGSPTEDRQGVSEDEGRDRLANGRPWRRGHGLRGLSYGGSRKTTQPASNEMSKPSTFRRALSGLGASVDGADGTPFSPWKLRSDRTSSLSAAKWRQIKAGLKMLGQRRRAENIIDHAKSAELMAELTAGVPAALILASMFQRDEHGHRRIPILLEQLKVKITDSRQVELKLGTVDRHVIFRIELEYGNGLTRMKWVIHRALRDFANLHARYKLQISTQRYIQLKGSDARTKLPHFPKSAFPYLRGIRGIDSESDEEDVDRDITGPSGGDASGTDRPGKKRRRSLGLIRRKSNPAADAGNNAAAGGSSAATSPRKDAYIEKQRRKLELYLQQMIRYLIFRPESNRLCKFLELSALGVRLAAEGSYHGKEGYLMIQSGKGVDFRKGFDVALIKGRHLPKWFLVRHSYVVCVDSPEAMNIYDVFLVDSSFKVQTKKHLLSSLGDQSAKDIAKRAAHPTAHVQHHTLKLSNSERKMKLFAKNERQLTQFEDSIRFISSNTPWALKNRFDSFAPVRPKCFAQWLVDGRDYMWNVSRAINMAKDVIYIHDWWLSPELYMRRPAAISQKWRLDRLLQRKAQEGVKVFVIIYRNINSAVPIDSEYSKFSLLDLHPNVFVQRSPNQMRQGTFFWAHHEKICVVDHMIAFVGGIDLCFGRWDTPQHVVADDKPTGFEATDAPKDADHCQLWPGKDYSNPRVQDFYALDKPYEEMYDRERVPRMPWHDVSMQVVGQPARDLTRHFVQRWNYILRQRKPTRPTPFLLPPPDFQLADLEALGLDGTCEVQILRSACMWSLGTPGKVEHSILNAYVKVIQQSHHFVYVENQFFVTSCEVEGARIENSIGDALVERIVRAAQKGEDWRAVIIIPLLPGFQNTVENQDGTSVRLIMQCQFRSISRGDFSIFGRLRAAGIEPEDYIQFFSLRAWGKIGAHQELVTEQLYIHAKCMIVDDRIAIIGSANINERSMLGSRDSECAAVVRDTDMLWSTMNGEPYLVGRFPHTLRMRLMREHLGIDVDEILDSDRRDGHHNEQWERDMDRFHGSEVVEPAVADGEAVGELVDRKHKLQDELLAKSENLRSFNHDVDWEEADNPNLYVNKKRTEDPRVTRNAEHRKDVAGKGVDHMKNFEEANPTRGRKHTSSMFGSGASTNPNLLSPESTTSPRRSPQKPSVYRPEKIGNAALPPPHLSRLSTAQLGLPMVSQLPALPKTDDTDIGGPSIQRLYSHRSAALVGSTVANMKRPVVGKDCMRDPLNDFFYLDTWNTVAENNTKLFRTVFRCNPDNEVKTWREYKDFEIYMERFQQSQAPGKSKEKTQRETPGTSGPPGQGMLRPIGEAADAVGKGVGKLGEKIGEKRPIERDSKKSPQRNMEDRAQNASKAKANRHVDEVNATNEKVGLPAPKDSPEDPPSGLAPPQDQEKTSQPKTPPTIGYSDTIYNSTGSQKRRRRTTTKSSKRDFFANDDLLNKADAEELLNMVQGNLVVWPTEWLASEEQGGNWLFSIDQLAPLEIYN